MTIRPRAIDHLVLPVTTLTLARATLTALGFTVAPDAQHPFGTGNCCVLFQNRTYLEPITILDRAGADMAAAEGNFFVRRLRRYTERRGEGFAMLALKSIDAEADRTEFQNAHFGDGPVLRFARPANSLDGATREIGVAVAFAHSEAAPDATFLSCQHLMPDALFTAELMRHANGALGVSAVVAVAENPADFHILLSTITGTRELRTTSLGIEAVIEGQSVSILTPAGFHARYGQDAPQPREGLLLAAFDIAVSDLRSVEPVANAARIGQRLVVPAQPGLGAVLAFAEVSHA